MTTGHDEEDDTRLPGSMASTIKVGVPDWNNPILRQWGMQQASAALPLETAGWRTIRFVVVGLVSALPLLMLVLAIVAADGTWFRDLWIELCGGTAIFAGTLLSGWWFRPDRWFGGLVIVLALLVTIGTYFLPQLDGRFDAGSLHLAQALFLNLAVGLVLLLTFETRVEALVAHSDQRLQELADRASELESALETERPVGGPQV